MPSRQDQLHSYQFAVQRVVAALVMRETDPAQSPFRRAAGATLASVLIAAIALGAVGVYGVFTGGGSTKWRTNGAVVYEKDSAARFVYLDGKLHPVLNHASALLLAGSSGQKPIRLSRKSLAAIPRGEPRGIPNAPDPLPDRGSLVRYPWTVCSAAQPGAGSGPRSTLLVGRGPSGGVPLGGKAVLARGPGDESHLLLNQRRHRIRDEEIVLSALGWTSAPVVAVAPALINSMPAGADLQLIDIPGRGEDFEFLPDAKVGEVFVVRGGENGRDQYAVAVRAGLAAITYLQAQLLIADPATRERVGQDNATELPLNRFVTVRKVDNLRSQGLAPPATPPEVATADTGAVCAVIDDDGVAELRVQAAVPDVTDALPTGKRSAEGAVLADFVRVEPGKGAVVEAVSQPGVSGGTLSVVTDLGRRYAVPNADVLGTLNLGGVKPVRILASVVALLPAGPALDPEAARAAAGQG